MKYTLLLLIVVLNSFSLHSQVVTSNPSPAELNKPVTIFFYADKGSKGLMNFSGDVYAHTGVVTSKSSGPTDWKYVKTNWGQNTNETKLVRVSTNTYSLTIQNIRQYYSVPATEDIVRMAFVFRSADASKEGKGDNNTDLFIDVLQEGMHVVVDAPNKASIIINQPDSYLIKVSSTTSQGNVSRLELFQNNVSKKLVSNQTTLEYEFTPTNVGDETFNVVGENSLGQKDSASFVIRVFPSISYKSRPVGIKEGVTIVNDSTVIFCLFAPYKKNAFLLTESNDFQVSPLYQMHYDTLNKDESYFWLEVSGFKNNVEYSYQYLVDGTIRVADPFAKKVLSEFQDPEIINTNRYPNLKRYPIGKTSEYVSVFRMKRSQNEPEFPFVWTDSLYQRPQAKDLIIYELLVRDFTDKRTFSAVTDSLDYLQSIGINAIELMPVNQADVSATWGYDPCFHMAMNKYYGTEVDLKNLINEAHKRGIAVILDVVYNHATGSSPLVRLWADGNYGPPSSINPYANVVARHPFNVFNDLNHESKATQRYVIEANRHWLNEFKFDGFRFDLSKGLTQFNSGSNVGLMGAYDSSRIRILKRFRDSIVNSHPTAYTILEHFADNREETELSNYGFMLWQNLQGTYSEAQMSWIGGMNDNGFTSSYFKNRGFTQPGGVGYFESHDEERLSKRNYCYGYDKQSNHNTRDTSIVIMRSAATHAFLFLVPGPKMMWQFQELGYDAGLQLQNDCSNNAAIRLNIKPNKWSYRYDSRRMKLFNSVRALNYLKKLATFNSLETDVSFKANKGDTIRSITFKNAEMNAVVVGNFGVTPKAVSVTLPNAGTWHKYLTEDSVSLITNTYQTTMQPGEVQVLLSKKVAMPTKIETLTTIEQEDFFSTPNQNIIVAPNPVLENQCTFYLPFASQYNYSYTLINSLGQEVVKGTSSNRSVSLQLPAKGSFYLVVSENGKEYRTVVINE